MLEAGMVKRNYNNVHIPRVASFHEDTGILTPAGSLHLQGLYAIFAHNDSTERNTFFWSIEFLCWIY